MARIMGYLKEIFLCHGIRHGIYDNCQELRAFLQLEQAHDVGTHRTFGHPVTWSLPDFCALPELPLPDQKFSFADEVSIWKEMVAKEADDAAKAKLAKWEDKEAEKAEWAMNAANAEETEKPEEADETVEAGEAEEPEEAEEQ